MFLKYNENPRTSYTWIMNEFSINAMCRFRLPSHYQSVSTGYFSLQVPLNITKTPSSNGSMTFHKVSIPNNDSVIISEILPSDNSSKLTIYLRYNEKPSLTEYDFKTTLPNRYLAEGNNYTLFVSRDQMKGKGEYYIGVWPSAHGKEEVQTVVNYTFDVICSACYFWDEEVKEWSSKGCQVSNSRF